MTAIRNNPKRVLFVAILKKFLLGSLFYDTASQDSRLLQVTLRGRLPGMFNPKLEAFYSQSLNVPLWREYVLNLRQGISQKCSPVYDLFKTVGYIQIRYNTGSLFGILRTVHYTQIQGQTE
jgi:hypothetical protein